jgi:hypothetical protein
VIAVFTQTVCPSVPTAELNVIVLVGLTVIVPLAAKNLLPGEEWLGLIGLLPLAGGVACIGFATVRSYRAAAGSFAMTAIAFVTLLFAVGTQRVGRHQANHRLLQAINAHSAHPQIASYKVLEPSWVFYGGLPIHEFSASKPETSRFAAELATQFLLANPNRFLITTEDKLRDFSSLSPPEVGVIASVPYFLRAGQRLVVLGRIGPSVGIASGSPAMPITHNDLR